MKTVFGRDLMEVTPYSVLRTPYTVRLSTVASVER
jgi:hypothetical protein